MELSLGPSVLKQGSECTRRLGKRQPSMSHTELMGTALPTVAIKAASWLDYPL
jgi:hypothetical protein